nr:hybrid pks-nrps synthetase [Quercus suber]
MTNVTVQPNVVMLFTGQGSQWAQMGRDLLRINQTFCMSITMLDEVLQASSDFAPSWTIAEELSRPARSSRLKAAELAQPLCTAIQIALVDTYVSLGIRPAAVIGHSSGEIAAAYVAQALTAREAITTAYYRGLVAAKQLRPGAMAAVNMGLSDLQPYLIDNVTAACDNSSTSVTISGDKDAMRAMLQALQQARPDISVTLLQVDRAYYSPHMSEIADEYYDTGNHSSIAILTI